MENLGFGTQWTDFSVDRYEGYRPQMNDYHTHDYYEISLILSGDVTLLLPDTVHHGTEQRLLLTPPATPHLVICEPSRLYKRINLLFSQDFLADTLPEWHQLLSLFGKQGRILPLDGAQCETLYALARELERESDRFRIRLLLMLFLSHAGEFSGNTKGAQALPTYINGALAYVQEHYADRLVAEALAHRLGVGRTTLMTAFRRYTGTTLGDYVTGCRLKHAVAMLRNGATEQETAEACGFGDACNMIRCFRRKFGTTPVQYLKEKRS